MRAQGRVWALSKVQTGRLQASNSPDTVVPSKPGTRGGKDQPNAITKPEPRPGPSAKLGPILTPHPTPGQVRPGAALLLLALLLQMPHAQKGRTHKEEGTNSPKPVLMSRLHTLNWIFYGECRYYVKTHFI